jgi:hypothetical protein
MKRTYKILALVLCFLLLPIGTSEVLSQRRSKKRPKVTPRLVPAPPPPSIEIIPGAKSKTEPYRPPSEPKRRPPLIA